MFTFEPKEGVSYRYDYSRICEDLNRLAGEGTAQAEQEALAILRDCGSNDLFFLLYFFLRLEFLNNAFHVPLIYEVQDNHNDTLDLWAREHGKSTIITKGLTIFDIIRDKEKSNCIFSFNRSIAKGFLRDIKTELETNALLKKVFPADGGDEWFNIFYEKPDRQSVKWSEDDGIVVKRQSVRREATVEAWGLTDGQPTSKHFDRLVYDDCVTQETTTTPEQIEKTERGYRMSLNLGRRGGEKRVIGTIYSFADLYSKLKKSGMLAVREHPAEDENGVPAYLTREELDKKRREMGVYVYNSQMLMRPVAAENKKFKLEWLSYFEKQPRGNYYIIVDPAGAKEKRSDYTVMWVKCVDFMHNRFYVDCIRDKMNLRERWLALKMLVEKWRPLNVGYEKYGLQSDIEYVQEKQVEESFFFPITPLRGGAGGKTKGRVDILMPLFEEKKIHLPRFMPYRQLDGKVVDIVQSFIAEEYLEFPFCTHDDLIDCMARGEDEALGTIYPVQSRPKTGLSKPFDPFTEKSADAGSWMTL